MRPRFLLLLALLAAIIPLDAGAQATRPPRTRRPTARPTPHADSLSAMPPESLATVSLFVHDSATGAPVWRLSAAWFARGVTRIARSRDAGWIRLERVPPGVITFAVSCDSIALPWSDVWLGNLRARVRAGADTVIPIAVNAASCDSRPVVTVEGTFIGRYTSAGDTSRFELCGNPQSGDILVRFDSTVGRLRWPTSSDPYRDVVYLRGFGSLIGPASFGADGRSAYELRMHRVDVIRSLLPSDCDGRFASP